MSYEYDSLNDVYIINLDNSLSDKSYQKIIREISLIEIHKGNRIMHTYFNHDYTHCIVDFRRQKIDQDVIESFVGGLKRR